MSDAARVLDHLQSITRVVREAGWAAARQHPIELTPTQVLALQLLVEDRRGGGAGLSVSELSQRMGLAHSTASGVVTRLERRGLVERTPRPDDRRYVRVELAEPVTEWLESDLAASRSAPVQAALAKATDEERRTILAGLAALERLLSRRAD